MSAVLADPRLIDAILLIVAVEAVVLIWQRLWRLLPMLGSGGALLVALRAALADSDGGVIAAALAAGGIAHLVDLRLRLSAGQG